MLHPAPVRPALTALLAALALARAQAQSDHEESLALQTPTGTLYGTLEWPEGAARPPVALIIAGSGPTDRDSNSPLLPGKNDSLKLLARALAARGIASVRYDKRGVGESRTAQRESDLTLDTFVNDAERWVTRLREDPRFGPLSIVGHSEGALIGLLAAKVTAPAGFVSVAGPGENLADTLTRQLHANPNNPPALLQEADAAIAALRAGHPVAQVSPVLAPLFRPSVQPFLISAFRYDPARTLAGLRVPTLIVQGDRDLQVTLEDARLLQAAKPDARLLIVPGMNHVLKKVGDDLALNQRAYSDPSLPLAPGLAEGIADFVHGVAR